MNPLVFIDSFQDDYDARVTAVVHNLTDALEISLEYDGLLLPTGTSRSATLKCLGAIEWNVSPGFIGTISYSPEHPLLLNHNGPQAQLFFSSAPASPSDVFFIAHKVLNTQLSGWRDPSEYLNGHPEEIFSHLCGGYGLLARGPLQLMNALAQALGAHLVVNLIPSAAKEKALVALTLGKQFVICQSAEVFDNGA